MSDDEADPELLALLRQSLGLGTPLPDAPPDTGVLKSAEYIYDNAVDVSISSQYTKAAAETIWKLMQEKNYSTQSWSEHELHPKAKNETTVNFIFTMNLLNFSFWSELSEGERFAVEYKGRRWTGYWSLVAALQRGLDEGHPITTPSFYASPQSCPDTTLQHIFRSATWESMPLLTQRISILRSAGHILSQPSTTPISLLSSAKNSAAKLVNLLTTHIDSFNDTYPHPTTDKQLFFHKRAQILVADLYAAFNNASFGHFTDIASITMFADYRVPQMLHTLGCLWYSPRLEGRIKRREAIESGESVEVEIRGCSIWCVELLRREIERRFGGVVEVEVTDGEGGVDANADANSGANTGASVETRMDSDTKVEAEQKMKEKVKINAVLIDFLLYDVAKEREREGGGVDGGVLGEEKGGMRLAHHRTRSIWY